MISDKKIKLLAVGPLPPPYGGTTVSFDIFREQVESRFDNVTLIPVDTSQKQLKKTSSIASSGNLTQAVKVVRQFSSQVGSSQRVIIFGSNGFQLSLMPFLLIIAKLFGKPCYIRPFGGSLDNFIGGLNPILRWWLLRSLRTADGVIVETDLLRRSFMGMGLSNVRLVPGYRPIERQDAIDAIVQPSLSTPDGETERRRRPFRVVFIGHVRPEKGVFVLLEAMKRLDDANISGIVCDIYGPIYHAVENEFMDMVATLPSVTYGGVLQPQDVIKTLKSYDVLAFPTFYQGEGHPGVVIEAMMAGLPVITTNFRAIPELIRDGNNGLLVPPHNPQAIADAMIELMQDQPRRMEMGRKNQELSRAYDAATVIPQLLDAINLPASDAQSQASLELSH